MKGYYHCKYFVRKIKREVHHFLILTLLGWSPACMVTLTIPPLVALTE